MVQMNLNLIKRANEAEGQIGNGTFTQSIVMEIVDKLTQVYYKIVQQ